MPSEQTEIFNQKYRVIAIIFLAQTLAIFLYGIVGWLCLHVFKFQMVVAQDMLVWIKIFLSIAALMAAVFGIFLKNLLAASCRNIAGMPLEMKLGRLSTGTILLGGLVDGAALLGFVLALMSGSFWDYVPFAVLAGGAMMAFYPRKEEWQRWVQD